MGEELKLYVIRQPNDERESIYWGLQIAINEYAAREKCRQRHGYPHVHLVADLVDKIEDLKITLTPLEQKVSSE